MSTNPIEDLLPMDLRVVHTERLPSGGDCVAFNYDLGLGEATNNVFVARRAGIGGAGSIAEIASDTSAWFTFIYLLDGEVTVNIDGARQTLRAHDAISQFPFTADTVVSNSPSFSFLEVQALNCAAAREILPTRPTRTIALDGPDKHVVGTGPRSFFDYRDLGVAEATGRLIEVQVVRAQRAKEGGTGWHSHNMAQLSFGLSGWAMLDVEQVAGQVRQGCGDALSIPAHWRHNASSFSDDYWALQLQIPADYDTVEREAPPPVMDGD